MTSTPANERSRASTIATPQPQPPSNLSKEDGADWLAIDRALSHIQSVNPSDPYVLTIPQEVEPRYRHSYALQARQWLDHTPFREGEHEASQYLTWHFHEPGDMYVLHSTRPREEREEASSRVGTPKVGGGGAKKTMSLGAYKKKVAGGTPGPDESKKAETNAEKKAVAEERKAQGEKSVKKPAVKGPVERVKADEEVLAAVEDPEDVLPPVVEKKKDEGKKDLKRKREVETKESREEVKRKREDSKMSEEREAPREGTKTQSGQENQEKAVQRPFRPDEPPATKGADQAPPHQGIENEQPPAKKAKTSASEDEPAKDTSEPSLAKQATPRPSQPELSEKRPSSPPKPSAEANDMALPPRLSPLREDANKDAAEDPSLLLPPRLSPTLPANITATLAARKHNRSTSKSSVAGDTLTPPRMTLENGVARRKSPVNGFRANSSSPMVRSDAEETRGRSKTSAPRVRSPSPSGEESEIAVGKAAAVSKKDGKSKLIVKLKFKHRDKRETLKQLLKLPAAKKKPDVKPSPALNATDARHREQRDTHAKGVAQKVGPATKGVAKKVEKSATSTPIPSEKRAREESSEAEDRAAKRKKADMAVYEPPGKRKKAPPESLDLKKTTPSTPSQPAQQPPTPKSNLQKPATQLTPSVNAPKKPSNELLAAATTSASMKRDPSHDSQVQVATPSASSSSPAASSATQPPNSAVPKSTPTTASTPASAQPKTQRQKDWGAQCKIFDDLGRELKRAATTDLTTLESKTAPAEAETLRRLAAVKTVESLLTYFVSFISDDETSLAAAPPRPLRPYRWITLKDYFPFVKRNTEPYPLLAGLAGMLAVVFCSRTIELSVDEKSVNNDMVSHAWSLLSHSAADVESKLDVRKLQDAFPKSWSESAKGALGEERLEPGKLAGAYKLPLGPQTKPIRALRAGYTMLREWMEKEGVEYEMRLKLE